SGICLRKTRGSVVKTANDMRVERAVSVTTLNRASSIGRAFEPIIDNAARLSRIAAGIQAEMARCNCAVVNAAIRKIHCKARESELPLRKSFRREPREITRPGWTRARDVAGDDLVLPFVAFVRLVIRLD